MSDYSLATCKKECGRNPISAVYPDSTHTHTAPFRIFSVLVLSNTRLLASVFRWSVLHPSSFFVESNVVVFFQIWKDILKQNDSLQRAAYSVWLSQTSGSSGFFFSPLHRTVKGWGHNVAHKRVRYAPRAFSSSSSSLVAGGECWQASLCYIAASPQIQEFNPGSASGPP